MALRYLAEAKKFGAALCAVHIVCRPIFGSHLAAHALPEFLGFCVLAGFGVRAWFQDGAYLELSRTPSVTAPSELGELVCMLQIPFHGRVQNVQTSHEDKAWRMMKLEEAGIDFFEAPGGQMVYVGPFTLRPRTDIARG